MPVHNMREIGIVASTCLFIWFTTPRHSKTYREPLYFSPVRLSSTSKFYRLFSFQFPQSHTLSSKSSDLSLYFIPSLTSCALVALLVEKHDLIKDDETKITTVRTRANSNEDIIYIFGYNTETKSFDLLLKRSVALFYGASADATLDIDCPDLIWAQSDQGTTFHIVRYKYHPERMRYVPR